MNEIREQIKNMALRTFCHFYTKCKEEYYGSLIYKDNQCITIEEKNLWQHRLLIDDIEILDILEYEPKCEII